MRGFAIRFPESVLPFSDKAIQVEHNFCEIMVILPYEE